jgi:hypothetical protein
LLRNKNVACRCQPPDSHSAKKPSGLAAAISCCKFLTEAVTLTVSGDLIGIVFSVLVTVLVSAIFPSLRC